MKIFRNEDTKNIMNTVRKSDRIKFILAYIVAPVLHMSLVGVRLSEELRHQYGAKAHSMDIPLSWSFWFGMLAYIPLVLPPTIIRFVGFRRGLAIGLELYTYMVISSLASSLLAFMITGYLTPIGLLGALTVYCILSYRSTTYSSSSRLLRYSLTFITLVFPFVAVYLIHEKSSKTSPLYNPIWEAVVACIILNTHKIGGAKSTEQEDPSPDKDTAFDEDLEHAYAAIVRKLVDVGLSHIGRKTRKENAYLTPETEQERHAVERPFLRLLADRYRDAEQRKILSKHFAFFKEMCLFIVFSALLRQDIELHERVKAELKARLKAGMTALGWKHRNDYWSKLSKNFYDEYMRTKDMKSALSYSFCRTLGELNPDIPEMQNVSGEQYSEYIFKIFKYSYSAVEAASQSV